MNYLFFNPAHPVKYLSCGILESEDGFVHPKRNIDSHVLILVQQGTLYITQNETEYSIGPGQYILLFADTLHFGTKPSVGPLSYFWTHFYVTDPEVQILNGLSDAMQKNISDQSFRDHSLILSEHGTLPVTGQSFFSFSQLIHTAKREEYRPSPKCSYATMLLLLEASKESLSEYIHQTEAIPLRLAECLEWLQHHYDREITISDMADRFQYNPAYLTTLIKKHTGLSFVRLLNQTRIAASKNLLANSELTIEAIARQCGFSDVKYFYRMFKKEAQMTPNEYRKHLLH